MKIRRWRTDMFRVLWVLACGTLLVPGGHAQTFDWDGTVSTGAYEADASWTQAGAPTNAADTARFNTGGSHTVTFDGDWTITQALLLGSSSAIFDLQGRTWTQTADATGANAGLVVGSTSSASAHFTGGGTNVFGRMTLGNSSAATGTLLISGPGTALQGIETNTTATVGGSGTALLTVSNQAALRVGVLAFGTGGRVVVDGSNSLVVVGMPGEPSSAARMRVSGELIIRNQGELIFERSGGSDLRIGNTTAEGALMVVESGGQYKSVTGGPNLELAYSATHSGTLIVRDEGSELFVRARDFRFGGVAATAPRQGTLLVHTGGLLRVGRDFIATAAGADDEWYAEVKGQDAEIRVTADFSAGEKFTLAIDRGKVTGRDLILDESVLQITLNSGQTNAPIVFSRNATLTNPTLEISLGDGFTSELDEVFTLLTAGTLTGTFAGKPDGHAWKVGDYVFEINYVDDEAVTLTVIPEPGGLVLLALAVSLVWMRRRRHRYA